ncbi:hypothetical protein BX600DRAFT_143970 [Xylariales sp. PMI_506]|nr:hypothetical protein BX600DRAFT_143970 [Xylariales sp. PMI_506]
MQVQLEHPAASGLFQRITTSVSTNPPLPSRTDEKNDVCALLPISHLYHFHHQSPRLLQSCWQPINPIIREKRALKRQLGKEKGTRRFVGFGAAVSVLLNNVKNRRTMCLFMYVGDCASQRIQEVRMYVCMYRVSSIGPREVKSGVGPRSSDLGAGRPSKMRARRN